MSKPPSIIDADMSRAVTPKLLKGLQGFVAFIDDGTEPNNIKRIHYDNNSLS